MADSSTPLTALCNICHAAAPKYTCPRDKVRTCSLTCARSHKRRAACNGLRDPSAYIPKSELSSASGIDRDYNFLSGVERKIDGADKQVSERGVSLSGHGKVAFEKRWQDNGVLGRYLREHGVVVHRAPVGMQRQRQNQTRWIQKSKRIVWSVEWVVEGEKKVVEVDESATVLQAYRDLLVEKERESKKRKRVVEDVGPDAQKQRTTTEKADSASQTAAQKDASDMPTTENTPQPSILGPGNDNQPSNDSSTQQPPSHSPPQTSSQDAPSDPPPHFYLHKPHTSSKNLVLIPLDPLSTITTSLAQKHLLEFPTIHVFSSPNSSADEENKHVLPEGFITLQQYEKEKKEEEDELKGLINGLPEEERKMLDVGQRSGEKEREKVDESAVLEVLQRDVEALKR